MVIRSLPSSNLLSNLIIRSGSIATVPYGWAVCDGTQGTPDLRDRFILGSGTHMIVNTFDSFALSD